MMAKKYLHNGICYKVRHVNQERIDDFLSVLDGFPSDPGDQELMAYDTWKYSMFLYSLTIGALIPTPSPDKIPDTRDSLQRLIHTDVCYHTKNTNG